MFNPLKNNPFKNSPFKKKEISVEVGKVTTDSLINPTIGMGGSEDKMTHGEYHRTILGPNQVSALYRSNGMAKKVIDIPIKDMLKAGREWDDNNEVIAEEEKRLSFFKRVKQAMISADIYGGSVIIMFVNGQDELTAPLNLEAIGKGDLIKLVVFDRYLVAKHSINYNGVLDDNYLMPEFYRIGSTTKPLDIHYTRVIEFSGVELPLFEKRHLSDSYWGDSRYNAMYNTLRRFDTTHSSVATMVAEANIDVFSVEGLPDLMSAKGAEAFAKRMALTKEAKSTFKAVVKDETEDYSRNQLSFTALPDVLGVFQTQLAAESDIPVTRLFGTSAKGLNATGKGDEANYHEHLEGRQLELQGAIAILDEVLVRSATGSFNGESYEFNPLQVRDEAEKATTEKTFAEAEEKYIAMGVISQVEVRTRIQGDGVYAIEDVNAVTAPITPPTDKETNNADNE
jgi:phage-related protein (TIGR01555 family)